MIKMNNFGVWLLEQLQVTPCRCYMSLFIYLEGIESYEDIGDYNRQMDKHSTQPGQAQHWQQDENWAGHSPANTKMHIHES